MASTDRVIARAQARQRLRRSPATVRMMREQAELTQADVAEALGCSQAAVCRYEAGQRVPRGDVAVRYLSLLRKAAGAY